MHNKKMEGLNKNGETIQLMDSGEDRNRTYARYGQIPAPPHQDQCKPPHDLCPMGYRIQSPKYPNGETVYRCPVCEKGCKKSAHATRHIKIHTGDKPYTCPICNMRFARNDNMKQHHRTHANSGRRPGNDTWRNLVSQCRR